MSYQFSQDPEEQLPDWLKALRDKQGDEPRPEEASSEEQDDGPEEAGGEENASDAVEDQEEEELDWLSEIRKRHLEEGEIEEEAAAPAEEKLVKPEQSAIQREADEEAELLEDTQPHAASSNEEEGEAQSSQADSSRVEEGGLAPGEIPSWLEAIRPKDASAPESQAPVLSEPAAQEAVAKGEEQEEEDPLAGLSGVIPAEADISQSGRSRRVRERLRVTRSQQAHRVTLEKMLANEGRVSERSSPEAARSADRLRWLISGVLLLAILVALIRDTQDAARPTFDAFPESAAVHELIEALPPSAQVLVGFELQPALYGELEAVASVVLNHLLEKQAQLTFISTQPTGPALADRLMREELSADAQYLNLGYLSGSTAALRQFASRPREASSGSELWNEASVSGINSISEFALVLVISSDAEDARAWLEQVAPHSADGLVIATSAQAGPLLFPYLQSEAASLRGLVGGFSGAAYYEKLRGEDGLASSYWDAYSYGLGVIVVIILIAALYGRFPTSGGARVSRKEEKAENAVE